MRLYSCCMRFGYSAYSLARRIFSSSTSRSRRATAAARMRCSLHSCCASSRASDSCWFLSSSWPTCSFSAWFSVRSCSTRSRSRSSSRAGSSSSPPSGPSSSAAGADSSPLSPPSGSCSSSASWRSMLSSSSSFWSSSSVHRNCQPSAWESVSARSRFRSSISSCWRAIVASAWASAVCVSSTSSSRRSRSSLRSPRCSRRRSSVAAGLSRPPLWTMVERAQSSVSGGTPSSEACSMMVPPRRHGREQGCTRSFVNGLRKSAPRVDLSTAPSPLAARAAQLRSLGLAVDHEHSSLRRLSDLNL